MQQEIWTGTSLLVYNLNFYGIYIIGKTGLKNVGYLLWHILPRVIWDDQAMFCVSPKNLPDTEVTPYLVNLLHFGN